MIIFLKVLLTSLKDKKARTVLVIFSIAVSAALIFANESFAKVCEQRFYQSDVRWGGNSDICIQTKQTVGSKEWIDTQDFSKYENQFKYKYEFIQGKALYEPDILNRHYFTMIGADINEFNSYNPLTLIQGDIKNWSGFKAIIGTAYAKKYNLKLNNEIKLELDGKKYDFRIAAISDSKGLFTRELADGGFVIVPKDILANIYKGETNLVFIKLKDSTQKTAMVTTLSKELGDYEVDYGVDDALIVQETTNYVMPFRISAVAVIFMSMFIIFTAFNLITLERIPIIGTLRSIGCSRKRINKLLIAESALLGTLGGLLGCLLGSGVLKIIANIYFANDTIALETIEIFNSRATLTAIAAAVVITVASAIVPILRITRTPIKNIILNDLNKKQVRKTKFWVVGAILMALCLIVPKYLDISFTGMIISNIIAVGALFGMIPVVRFLTYSLSRIAGKIPFLNYNISLGLRNIHDNKSLLNNIQLLSAAIAIVAFMATIFNSMNSDLIKAYDRDTKFDINLVLRHTNNETLTNIAKVEGVESCFGVYRADPRIINHQTFFNMLYGIENDKFFDYYAVKQLDANKTALANLNKGKNIITTNILKDKLGLKLGDILVIQFGNKEVNYNITGFLETNLGIGHVGYISAQNFKEDMKVSDYSEIYVKSRGDPQIVKGNVLKALTKDVMSIDTKDELRIANSDKVVPMFNAISVYSYIALLVGLIGILNNLGVSFLERKRSFAVLRSVGMSRKGLSKMLITEAVAMGLCGIIFGLVSAFVMSSAIPAIVGLFWGKVSVVLAVEQMAIMGAAGMFVMFLIALVPVVKGSKLSIMESIRYE